MGYPSFNVGDVLTAADMNAVGLWKVHASTFTNQTAINVDNVFTTDYQNYKIIVGLRPNTTGTGAVELQLRSGGANLAAVNYVWQGVNQNVALAPTQNNGAAATGWYFTNYETATNYSSISEVTITSPREAAFTGYMGHTTFAWTGPTYYYRTHYGFYPNTATADGFRLVASSGITGYIKIYGYRN